MKVLELENVPLDTLRQTAKDLDIPHFGRMKKEDLILRIQQAEAEREGLELRGGILEIMSDGIGFLRSGITSPVRMMSTSRNPRSAAITCAMVT